MTVLRLMHGSVDDSIRPVEFEDLSSLDSVGGRADAAERQLPAWIDEVLAQQQVVEVGPVAIPVVLAHVEEMLDAEPPAPAPDPIEQAAAEERREVSIAFELGHRAGFDHGRREGHAEGHRAGLDAGRLEALLAGQESAARLLDALQEQVARHGARLEAVADEVAAAATELAFGIAEVVLQRELTSAADPGADAIRRAVAALPHAGATVSAAVVRLHPDDAAALTADPGDLLVGAELTILADAEVEPGACLLDVGSTRVDASLSSALARVREVLEP